MDLLAPSMHRPHPARRSAAAMASVLLIGLSACGTGAGDASDDDTGFTPSAALLQPEDLPAEPSSADSTTSPGSIGRYCDVQLGSLYGPAWDTEGVEYEGVAGSTVVSTIGRDPSPRTERLEVISDAVAGCSQNLPDDRQIEPVDLGENRVGFRADAYDAAQAPAGSVGVAQVDDLYVVVSIADPAGGGEGAPDLSSLLDAAVSNAQASSP